MPGPPDEGESALLQPFGLLLREAALGDGFVQRLGAGIVDGGLELVLAHAQLVGDPGEERPDEAVVFLGRRTADGHDAQGQDGDRHRYHHQSLHLLPPCRVVILSANPGWSAIAFSSSPHLLA